MNNPEEIFEDGEEFKVDLSHLMDDIAQVYSFEHWKLPIVENVDNFIDEKEYHTISFYVRDGELKIEMKGTGISETQFKELAKIAFTTKISIPEDTTLGYYGWGLKATMVTAETIEIETKRKAFRGRQIWYWKEKCPYRVFKSPCLDLPEDSTVLTYKLKEEYKLDEKAVIETLQEYYPTVLAGAPALGKKRKFYVNGKEVPPPSWLDENRYKKVEMLKSINIKNEQASGKVFISEEELVDEIRGLAVIVCGRKMEERFNPYPEVKKYTGYIHADFFAKRKYLISDKTQIKRRDNPLWQDFKTKVSLELEKILKNAGFLQTTTQTERKLIQKVHKVLTAVLREMPELRELGIIGPLSGKAEIYTKGGNSRGVIEEAPSTKPNTSSTKEGERIDQYGYGGKGRVIKDDKNGKESVSKREGRIRGYPQPIITELPEQIEAKYEVGKILINKQHPLYKSVERNEQMRLYHVSRAGLEAVLDQLLKDGEISQERYLILKRQITYLLGGNL
ncbi:MAG: ATP-binding protein [Thermoproteota archaeon]